jgi:hypothetical protein
LKRTADTPSAEVAHIAPHKIPLNRNVSLQGSLYNPAEANLKVAPSIFHRKHFQKDSALWAAGPAIPKGAAEDFKNEVYMKMHKSEYRSQKKQASYLFYSSLLSSRASLWTPGHGGYSKLQHPSMESSQGFPLTTIMGYDLAQALSGCANRFSSFSLGKMGR